MDDGESQGQVGDGRWCLMGLMLWAAVAGTLPRGLIVFMKVIVFIINDVVVRDFPMELATAAAGHDPRNVRTRSHCDGTATALRGSNTHQVSRLAQLQNHVRIRWGSFSLRRKVGKNIGH
jgi:hypothetical protein